LRIALAVVIFCSAMLSFAQMPSSLHLMPVPAHVQTGDGQLIIDPSFTVTVTSSGDARLQRGVARFLNSLRDETGLLHQNMQIVSGTTASLVVHADHASKEIPEVGEDESYTLEITSSSAKLNAPTTLGALHGLQTFLQLVENTPSGFAVPAVSIQDAPRFPWRGLLIDVGRHYVSVEGLKHNLDGMAAVKMNVLHWHVSDYQGFRIESKKFPKLTQLGSDGLFYTQDEVKDLVNYAADRGIRILPEFDMPGHSTSWFLGYPELASGSGPYHIEREFGVFDPAMDITRESTYKFLEAFLDEMGKLFPDHYFHVGGDEVNGKEWDANPKIQEFKRAHNFTKNDELQAYFNTRIQKILSKQGKIMVGWDEILQPGIPKDIVIQSWRGQESLANAAKQGYSGILSSGYYLDLIWPTDRHYVVDPLTGPTASLSPEETKHILGGEACMWGEHVTTETIDSRIWPRAAAIAERLWSPQSVTNIDSMYERMVTTGRWLDWTGLTHNSGYAPMLRRIAGSDDIHALRTLADVVEPAKDYQREELATTTPTTATPLNRLIDASRPESMTARHFAKLVDVFVSGKTAPGTEDEIRALLSRWRTSEADLRPFTEQSFLLKDVAPISKDLSGLGTAGLEALDYINRHVAAPKDWTARQLAVITEAKKPKAQVLLMVVPAVQKLVEAAGGQPLEASVH
jgi:hexosaminidase